METGDRRVTFHFLNGNVLTVEFPIQAGDDMTTAVTNVRKALEADRIAIEVDGDLVVIPWAILTYVQIHPAPEAMPQGVIRGARLIETTPE